MLKQLLFTGLLIGYLWPAMVLGQASPSAADYFNEGIQKSNAKAFVVHIGERQLCEVELSLRITSGKGQYRRRQ